MPDRPSRMHCYRGLRCANPEARFSRSVLARENPFSRPMVAETEFVITLDGHFSYYLPGPLLTRRGRRSRHVEGPLCVEPLRRIPVGERPDTARLRHRASRPERVLMHLFGPCPMRAERSQEGGELRFPIRVAVALSSTSSHSHQMSGRRACRHGFSRLNSHAAEIRSEQQA